MLLKSVQKLGFFALSLLMVYHAIAIGIVGPFYKSAFRSILDPYFEDYLEITGLAGSWSFYAPEPYAGSFLFYETVSPDGTVNAYPLTQAHAKFDHAYFRYSTIYYYLFGEFEENKARGFDRSAANYFCNIHSGEEIASVNFVFVEQEEFTHHDYNAGKRPLDPEFLVPTRFNDYQCTQ